MTWAYYCAVVCPLLAGGLYLIAAIGYGKLGNPWMAWSFVFWAAANVGLVMQAR